MSDRLTIPSRLRTCLQGDALEQLQNLQQLDASVQLPGPGE